MKTKITNFVLLGSGILILLTAIAVRGSQLSQANASSAYPPPNELPTATLSWCDQQKKINDNQSPQSKPIMSDEEYKKCIAALTAMPQTKALKPSIPPVPTRSYIETRLRRIAGNGILIEGLLGGISPQIFLQTNTWYEMTGDRFIYVYGGVKRDATSDLNKSAVAISVSDLAGKWQSEGGIFEAPEREGELTIIDAKGAILTLQTPNGNLLFFDVASHKYINPSSDTITSSLFRNVGKGVMVEQPNSPFLPSYIVTNHWYKDDNGKRISIFAGRTPGNAGQAVILLTNSLGEPTASDQPEIYTVSGYSASDTNYLRIFDVNGDNVFLAGKRGGEYVFDISLKRFLTLDEVSQLPLDPGLLALEASYQKIKMQASNSGSEITPTIPTSPAYP